MNNAKKKRLTGAAAIVMSSIVLSRLTGFVREMLVPNFLGVNEIGDAYNIAFKVTGLMYDLLVGGAIAAALIPVLTGYLARDEEEDGWKAVGTFINVVFILMLVVCILGIIFAPQIVPVIAIGFKKDATELTIRLTRILFPSVAFLMLAGLSNGVLNSYQRFAAAAYGPTVYNIGSALSILLLSRISVESVAYGVMCSAFIYFLFQLSFAFKNLKYYRLRIYANHPGFLRLVKLAVPSLVSSSIVQVNVIMSGTFASLFSAGSVTALNMADRTWQMPYGVFAQGMGIAILPALSAEIAVGKVEEFKRILLKGLKTVLLLSTPSAVGFIVLREPIIRTIFKFTNKFGEGDVVLAGNILMFFSAALLTQSVVAIMNRAFYANNDTKTPLYVGFGTIITNFTMNLVLVNLTHMGVSGIALAYSLSSALNALILILLLNKKIKGMYLDELLAFMAKVFFSALVMGAIVYALNVLLPGNPDAKLEQVLYLSIEIALGASVYFALAILFKVEEAQYISGLFLTRFKKVLAKCKKIQVGS